MLNRRFRSSTLGCVLLAALVSTTPAHALPTTAVPLAVTAPSTNVDVTVTVDNHTIGTFSEVVSISAGHEPGVKGSKKFSVVIRRQATRNMEFAAWAEIGMADPDEAKKQASITVTVGGTATLKFALTKAFPTKVEYASVGKSDVVMETVTMTCETLKRVAV